MNYSTSPARCLSGVSLACLCLSLSFLSCLTLSCYLLHILQCIFLHCLPVLPHIALHDHELFPFMHIHSITKSSRRVNRRKLQLDNLLEHEFLGVILFQVALINHDVNSRPAISRVLSKKSLLLLVFYLNHTP